MAKESTTQEEPSALITSAPEGSAEKGDTADNKADAAEKEKSVTQNEVPPEASVAEGSEVAKKSEEQSVDTSAKAPANGGVSLWCSTCTHIQEGSMEVKTE